MCGQAANAVFHRNGARRAQLLFGTPEVKVLHGALRQVLPLGDGLGLHIALHHDHAHAALAKLNRNYRPIAVLDSHEFTVAGRYLEKFHGVQRYDALLQTPTTANVHEFVGKAANEWYLLPMQKALTDQGMRVKAFDPVAGPNAAKMLADNKLVEVVNDQYDAIKDADALMVVTEWNQFRNPDFAEMKLALRAPILFDGRNLYNPTQVAEAGFAYFCIGQGAPGLC